MNGAQKKQKSLGFYCSILAAIVEIAGIICFTIMGQDGEGLPGSVYAVSIIGVILQAATIAFVAVKGDNRLLDIVGIVVSVLYALALVLMIQTRVGVITNILAAHTGTIGMPFILTTVGFAAALVVQMVNGFLSMEKN